jgi:hypothetical protein
MTAWTDFVRKWADKHNKSFACSMIDADCKKMYHATKAKKGKDLVKERRNEEAEKMGMAAEDHPAPAKAKPAKAKPAPVKPPKKTVKAPEVKRKRRTAPKWIAEMRKELRKLTMKQLEDKLDEYGVYLLTMEEINENRKEHGMKLFPPETEEDFRRRYIQTIILEESYNHDDLEVPTENKRTNIKVV